MQKLWITLLSICLLNNYCIGQDKRDTVQNIYSWNFYEYLDKSGLHEDALTWLLGYPDSLRVDSADNKINLEISKHYYAINQPELANTFLRKVSEFKDSASLNFAICIAFLVSDTLTINTYTSEYKYLLTADDLKTTVLMLKILKRKIINKNDISQDIKNDDLRKLVIKYSLHKKKSPFLAGLLSIIPGLGKFYLGYKYQAISAFTMNASLGAISVECLCKSSGILRWIIPLPVSVIFYSGNIYGSVLLAKKREIDFQNDIHESIKAYYRNKLLHCK